MEEVKNKAQLAKAAAQEMNRLSSAVKNQALLVMAEELLAQQAAIIAANQVDLQRERSQGMSESLLDRLALTPERMTAIAEGLRQIVELEDPVGSVLEEYHRPNGLRIVKKRVPLGVIGIIYEARPNVTVDAIGLCLKTGNTVVLRGGSAALESNKAIVEVLRNALVGTALPPDSIQLIHSSDRASVNAMLTLNGLLDVIIPRGGAALIQNVVQNATVPVIETGAGICHTYIEADADPAMAEAIAVNAKVQRPSVCNAMETLLVNINYPVDDLRRLINKLQSAGVSIYACERTLAHIEHGQPASDSNYRTEYNDYTLNVRIVDDLDQAIAHIQTYGTMHSECIVTSDLDQAERFMQRVDAAAVYHNASTRFTDGFEFGFGAEIGISTQKLHARGPMGLPALTSSKYLVYGDGQIR